MKIVYYLPSLYIAGGLERIITLKANYFADFFGYSVTILTSEQHGKKPYYELSENVNHVDLGVSFDFPINQSKIIKAITYPIKYYFFRKRFSSFLYNNKPDITISTLRREINFINSINDGSIKIGEFHASRNNYQAMSINSNNYIINIVKNIWAKNLISRIKELSKFIILTSGEKTSWSELNNTLVIHNPLTFLPKQFSTCTEKQVIAIGRYTFEKGFDRLIDAWALINKKHPDWTLKIFGYGDHTIYINQIEKLNIKGSCILESATTKIENKYCESSIFALSSRFEGFGLVICEAMACGVPAVAFDCPWGPREIIANREDGFLVENGNIEELADKICYLIENEEIRKEMGKQARINSERFKMENIAIQWKELFDSLLEQKKIK